MPVPDVLLMDGVKRRLPERKCRLNQSASGGMLPTVASSCAPVTHPGLAPDQPAEPQPRRRVVVQAARLAADSGSQFR